MKRILIPLLALALLCTGLTALAEEGEAVSVQVNTAKLSVYEAGDPWLDGLLAEAGQEDAALPVLVVPVMKSVQLSATVQPKTVKNKKVTFTADDADILRITAEQLMKLLKRDVVVYPEESGKLGEPYLVEAQDTVFCLMTDAGRVTDEMATYINRAHYLVIEANHDREMLQQGPYPQHLKERIVCGTGHLNNEACAQAIATNMSEHLRQVWLCHLSEENNHPELARKTVEAVLRSYGIVPGTDLKLEVLKRTMPTGIFDLEPPTSE